MTSIHVVIRERQVREAVVYLLTDRGHTVDTAPSLLDAAHLDPAREGIIVADWVLASGLLAEENRAALSQLTRRHPLVLLAPGSWGRLLAAEDLGVTTLLPKPFTADQLLAAVEQATEVLQKTPEVQWARLALPVPEWSI